MKKIDGRKQILLDLVNNVAHIGSTHQFFNEHLHIKILYCLYF